MEKLDAATKLFEALSRLPKELVVLIISALPIVERTGAPIAVAKYHMPIWEAFVFAGVGMALPILPILLLLGPVSGWLEKHSHIMARILGWIFEHTRRKHSEKIDRYGALGLFLFVAVPLPLTGSWTGALLAYLFDIDLKYALPSLFIGALAAAFLASLATAGAVAIVKLIGGLALGVFILLAIGALFAGRLLRKRGQEDL